MRPFHDPSRGYPSTPVASSRNIGKFTPEQRICYDRQECIHCGRPWDPKHRCLNRRANARVISEETAEEHPEKGEEQGTVNTNVINGASLYSFRPHTPLFPFSCATGSNAIPIPLSKL
jgi:hypothetical protein